MSAREQDFPHREASDCADCALMPLHAAPTARWGSHGGSILTRSGVSPASLPAGRKAPSYFEVGAELEGDLTAGPLLLPGNPGTLAAS
jgi:hypothetical protein